MKFRSTKKFNPQLMSKEELYKTFVGRDELLEDILKRIEDQTHKPSIQHFILIGPRGIGKTNLMQMIKYGIQDDPRMKDNWLPVVFSEEDFEIYGLRSFFEKIIDLILEEGPSESLLETSLNENRLLEDDKIAIEKSMVMIQKLSDSLRKQFIVFVDNLDSLLMEQLPDGLAVKKLRKFLTTNNSILLFGGAVKVFDEILSYNEPLFSHFAPIELSPLDYETIEAFIKGRAEYEGEEDILKNFYKFRSKIKAVSDLTGGNPRLILILYEIISEKEFDAAVEILMGVLDDMTSYYQDILKNLPAKERKVLDTIMRSDIKMTSTSLSSKLRWKQNEISSLLKRLRERQIVEGKKASKGREVYYETTDSVFRIFYQMRYLNKQRRRLGFIIDFLQRWYSLEELRKKIREYKYLYEKCFSEISISDASGKLEKAFYFADTSLKMGDSKSLVDLVGACIMGGNLDEAMEELEHWKSNVKGTKENESLYFYHMAWISEVKHDYIKVLKYLEKAVAIKPDYYEVWNIMGYIYGDLKQNDKAISACEKAVEIKPDYYEAWNNMGTVYSNLKQYDKAISACEKAVEIKPDYYEAWDNMGTVYSNLKQYDEAISAYEKVVETKPNHYGAWYDMGVVYSDLKQYDKAISVYEKTVEFKPDYCDAWYNMGTAYGNLKQNDKAVSAFEKAVEINPNHYEAWYNMGNIYIRLDSYSKTLKVLKQYLFLCKQKEILHKEMINAFFGFFYNKLHVSFRKREKSQYFTFFKESLGIIKAYPEIDSFQVLGFFYTLLLKDSEFSFFNDCLVEVKAVLGNDVHNSLSFYKTAACYLETKNISILEKLNFEERKPVDLILKEIENM